MSSSSSWIGQLDIHSWAVTQMTRELKNNQDASDLKMQQLNKQDVSLNNQRKIYTQLQTLLATFQGNLNSVKSAFTHSYQVTSSNTSVATAQVSGSATAGSHTLQVTKLAQAESIASKKFSVSSATEAIVPTMGETLNISVGSSSFTVPLNSDANNLQKIAENINIGAQANNVGVTASVTQTADGKFQLIVASNQTGDVNKVTVTETNITGESLGITSIGAGGEGVEGTQLTQARDAEFTLDSLSYKNASNSNISVQGMNINLLSDSGATTSLVVSSTDSISTATSAIQGLIATYNQIDALIEQSEAAGLMTDSGLSSILSFIQNGMKTQLSSGAIQSLGDLGILKAQSSPITFVNADGKTMQYTLVGQLEVSTLANVPKLADMLTTNFTEAQNFFTGTDGLATTLSALLVAASGGISKTMDNSVLQVNKQVDGVEKEIDKENERMEKLAKDLKLKYAALEASMTSMQITSQFLTSQISVFNK